MWSFTSGCSRWGGLPGRKQEVPVVLANQGKRKEDKSVRLIWEVGGADDLGLFRFGRVERCNLSIRTTRDGKRLPHDDN